MHTASTIALGEGDTIFRVGKLFQQHAVDSYACIEQFRLYYIEHHQERAVRSEKQ